MAALTTHERTKRMYEHRDADRVPIMDGPWAATVERWHREGMPEGVSYIDFFDLDRFAHIGVDNSPRYETRTLEETDAYVVYTSSWGVTLKSWKHAASTPEFLDFTIVDRPSWQGAKKRMTPAPDRVDWDYLKKHHCEWRDQGQWIEAGLWFGFDVTHSWAVGTERLLMALLEDPDWCVDMFNHFLDVDLAMLDHVWNEGYTFDAVSWPDDLGYKGSQFFSIDTYRAILKPIQKRAADWAHAKGVKVRLHSCGDVRPFIPEFLDIGIDALNPLEVKAGVDTLAVKHEYGDRLVIHGGINAVHWDDPPAIEEEMQRKLPILKQNGGYIFASDHSIPSSVSLEDFRRIITLAKTLGSYE